MKKSFICAYANILFLSLILSIQTAQAQPTVDQITETIAETLRHDHLEITDASTQDILITAAEAKNSKLLYSLIDNFYQLKFENADAVYKDHYIIVEYDRPGWTAFNFYVDGKETPMGFKVFGVIQGRYRLRFGINFEHR